MPLEQKKLAAAGLATREERVAAFKAFDLDGSGSVSIDEVMRIMCRETEFGAQFSIAEAKEHIDEFDSNSDGSWSLDEFLTFCEGSNDHGHGHDTMVQKALTGKAAKMAMLGLADREDIVAAFEAFDKDRDGRVSVAEIITVMCRETVGKGAQFTKDEAQEHLDEFDHDGNGTWSLDEFVDFCQGTNDHGHGHDTMVKESLVGESAIASYNFGVLRTALGVFDTAAKGRLPEKEVVSILTRNCGRGSASSDTTISLEDAQKIAELCAEKDIATGERMVSCDALCRVLVSTSAKG